MTDKRPLTEDEANAVYDVLVKHCGARADDKDRRRFVHAQIDEHCDEYRFMGLFGFGGKFRRNSGHRPDGSWGERWYVDYYLEDKTKARDAAVEAATGPLDALRAQHETAIEADQ